MPVLTMPGKTAVRTSLDASALSRNLTRGVTRGLNLARRPLNVPRWAIVVAIAVLGSGGFLLGRHRPAHHYVAYFGYPLVLDTTTGKACYAVPPRPNGGQDPAFPLDGTANQYDTQTTAGSQIPVCGQD